MKKRLEFLFLAMVFFVAIPAWAGGHGNGNDIDVDMSSKLSASQYQKTDVKTEANAASSAASAAEASSGGNTFTSVNEDKREHIAPYQTGGFVEPPATPELEGWTLFACQPMFQTFEIEELESMKIEGKFIGYKGGFFNKLLSSPVKKVIHKKGTYNNLPIKRLDWIPEGNRYYPSDKILGEYEVEGRYGFPWGGSLARGLNDAKHDTGTTRVVVWYRIRKDPKNSGMSIGSGAAGAKVFGKNGDATAGAIGLGGLIGTTTAYVDYAYDFKIWAMNDGPIDPPPGFQTICEEQIKPEEKPESYTTEEEPQCDSNAIQKRIEELKKKIKECTRFCYNNLTLRSFLGEAYIDLYVCTGDKNFLKEAMAHFDMAEKNYLHGWDIRSHQAEADKIIAQVYYCRSGCIYVLEGREAAIRFGYTKKLERICTGFEAGEE